MDVNAAPLSSRYTCREPQILECDLDVPHDVTREGGESASLQANLELSALRSSRDSA